MFIVHQTCQTWQWFIFPRDAFNATAISSAFPPVTRLKNRARYAHDVEATSSRVSA
jgi:hypothetical protein